MPSLPGLASDHGLSWKTYTGSSGYPVKFYKQLQGSPNIARSADIIKDAQAGSLPALSMVWHDSPLDDHPPADVSKGMDAVWQIVDAITKAGAWDSTVFLLTWDDWGGYDDHVATPNVEVTPDGVQLAYGPRVPLLIFGGRVKPGIDHRWSWHPSIPKTALDLLGLPKLGVPRVDNDKGLADLVDISASPKLNPAPPAHRTTITQPTPPQRHPSQRQLRSRRSPCPFRSARSCCGTGPTCPHQRCAPHRSRRPPLKLNAGPAPRGRHTDAGGATSNSTRGVMVMGRIGQRGRKSLASRAESSFRAPQAAGYSHFERRRH
jgi:hypothetical protein